jgi:hypothetical protein
MVMVTEGGIAEKRLAWIFQTMQRLIRWWSKRKEEEYHVTREPAKTKSSTSSLKPECKVPESCEQGEEMHASRF